MKKRFFLFAVFGHIILLLTIGFFASKEGILGEKMKSLTVALIPKKEKVVESKIIEKKPSIESLQIKENISIPKTIVSDKPNITKSEVIQIPSVAPEISHNSDFSFDDGAKEVMTITNVVDLYKNYIEYKLKSMWNCPTELNYVTDVNLTIDKNGKILNNILSNPSGNRKWDDSIKNVFSKIKSLDKIPPKEFPETFVVRFDIIEEE